MFDGLRLAEKKFLRQELVLYIHNLVVNMVKREETKYTKEDFEDFKKKWGNEKIANIREYFGMQRQFVMAFGVPDRR